VGDPRTLRRSLAISAYVGENGGGKSLALVFDTLPSLGMRWHCRNPAHKHTAEGVTSGLRTILSTVRFTDPVTGGDHPQYVRLEHWHQLLDAEHTDICLDEVQGVVSSRSHQSLPPAVLNTLLQLRRADNVCRWSTPAYARADAVLREVTQAVTYCKGFRRERVRPCSDPCPAASTRPLSHGERTLSTGERARPGAAAATASSIDAQDGLLTEASDHECVGSSLWGAKRWFLWRTYDAFAFDEFTTGKRESLPRLTRQFYRRMADDAQDHYDTLAQVSTIIDVSESGQCLRCGGARRRPKCECASAGGEDGAQRRPQLPAAPTRPSAVA
jgi:hypothetical protein